MKKYLDIDPWKIVERGFHQEENRISESIFSLGNGRFGQRGNFEEHYSGDTLPGNYFAGIYYPDKTRVGWWKIGYPEYFAKVLNAVDWAGVDISLDGNRLDLNQLKPRDFIRTLDMRCGLLQRTFQITTDTGSLEFSFERFCSMHNKEIGAMRMRIRSIDFAGPVSIKTFLNWDVVNEDANWEEKFWKHRDAQAGNGFACSMSETKKSGFVVASAMQWDLQNVDQPSVTYSAREKYCDNKIAFDMTSGQDVIFDKITGHQSSMYHDPEGIFSGVRALVKQVSSTGYEALRAAHAGAWKDIWEEADVVIEGDEAAQQGIRFNIFQLFQTYTGDDPRLNIGPKGFTGEKYGGSTYWDTEAYCLPFYLGSCDPVIAKQLLIYRYRHLEKAIENAEKLGFTAGAALYPMVTINGEECHNEWEITFEEIHRNGAMAYGIYDYIRHTGDQGYLLEGGLEVLIAIARFWAQRVSWSEPRQKFVILGVTGPNEYENNVDNNWYTNYIARWSMQYSIECIDTAQEIDPDVTQRILNKVSLQFSEPARWNKICVHLYLPEDPSQGIFLQQDNYLEKEQRTADTLPEDVRPLNQNWSWDRILRSCYIKQADVLQGLFFFEDDFDRETIRRNFLFYEARTVHESSLSPCVHSILASALQLQEKAYEMYLRTSRLDLEDYNNDTEDGLHITSMAGTWMAVVKGFAGFRVRDDHVYLSPNLPSQWESLQFQLHFRGHKLQCHIKQEAAEVYNICDRDITLYVFGSPYRIPAGSRTTVQFTESTIH